MIEVDDNSIELEKVHCANNDCTECRERDVPQRFVLEGNTYYSPKDPFAGLFATLGEECLEEAVFLQLLPLILLLPRELNPSILLSQSPRAISEHHDAHTIRLHRVF